MKGRGRAGSAAADAARVVLPRSVLDRTMGALRNHGKRMLECHALWVGRMSPGAFEVSDVWIPEQRCTPLSYEVGEREVFRINKALYDAGLTCMCQVHTHPGAAFHSEIDDQGSELALPGSLSVVIPNYGRAGRGATAGWRVYVYDGRRWTGMARREAEEAFALK